MTKTESGVTPVGAAAAVTEVYECDYEQNCTPLYKAIETSEEEEEYESILDFLETGVWTGPFEGLDFGPEPMEQVKTWVTRFDSNTSPSKDTSNKVKWSQLPLHLAIVCGAPAQIVASLVKLYPEALRCTDDQHMLPLHLALRHEADDEIIAFLLIQFPEAVNAKGKNGRTAVDCALRAKDKLRGIILEIFTEKTATKIITYMQKEKKEIKNELENRTSELLTTSALLDEKTKEYDSEKSKYMNTIEELQKSKLENEQEYQEKIKKMKGEQLVMEVIHQKKMDQLLVSVKERENSEKKVRQDEMNVKRELETLQGLIAASKSNATDWNAVKLEAENLKQYRLQKTRTETQKTIQSLQGEIETTIEETAQQQQEAAAAAQQQANQKGFLSNPIAFVSSASSVASTGSSKMDVTLKNELKQLKNKVDKISKMEMTTKTSSELTTLRNEVESLRHELKERAAFKNTKVELAVMKKAMEMELRNSTGKTQDEMIALKKAIASTNAIDLEKKTTKEIQTLKVELDQLKKDMKEKELVTRTKEDVDLLKVQLEKEMVSTADSKTRSELNKMKLVVDSIQSNLDTKTKTTEDMVLVRQEVDTLRDELKKKETSTKIKLEAAMLKKMVETELLNAQGQTQKELVQMKQMIHELVKKANNNDQENDRDVEELKQVREELKQVKEELKAVETITKTQMELENLKRDITNEISQTKGKTEEEFNMMRSALDAMNLEQSQSRELKLMLEDEMKVTSGKTEEELKQLKKTIDQIDLHKIELKNQKEWETVRKEMDILTAFLKKRQVDGVGETKNELKLVKDAVAAIDINKIEKQQKNEFDYLKCEMDNIKKNMEQKQYEEEQLKRELEYVKAENAAIAARVAAEAELAAVAAKKKKKNGLRSFFVGLGLQKNGNSSMNEKGTTNGRSISTPTPLKTSGLEVKTIAPPSLAASTQLRTLDSMLGEAESPPPTNNGNSTNNNNNYNNNNNNDDSSYSSAAMKDAEKSRHDKANEIMLLQSKSRDFGSAYNGASSPINNNNEESSYKSGMSSSKNSKKSHSSSNSHHSNNHGMNETFKIVSLHQSKSEMYDSGSSSKNGGGNHSLKSAKSTDYSSKTGGSRISKPISITRITSPNDFADQREGPPPSSSSPVFSSATSLTSSMKGSKPPLMFRKAKSMMDPRLSNKNTSFEHHHETISSSNINEPYQMTNRTKSKPVVNENGEIELHRVDEDEDEDTMIQPRVSFVSHF